MDPKERAEIYKTYIKTSAVGLEVFLSLAIGAGLGLWLNRYIPYGLWVGMGLGALTAAKSLYTFTKKYIKNDSFTKPK